MNIRRLEHFLALLDFKQFKQAASELGVSQQAVSKAITRLEEEVGQKLFERSAYGVTPTDAARMLEKHARLITSESRLAVAELNALAGKQWKTLKIGVGLSLSPGIMPIAINRFRQLRPGTAIEALVDFAPALHRKLLEGEIALMVGAPPPDFQFASAIKVETLFEEVDMVAVRAGHPLAGLRKGTVKDLLHYPWITPPASNILWRILCQAFAAEGLPPPSDLVVTDSVHLTLSLLLADDYLALVDTEAYAQELLEGRLNCIDIEGLTVRRSAIVAYREQDSIDSSVRTMIDIVQSVSESRTTNTQPMVVAFEG